MIFPSALFGEIPSFQGMVRLIDQGFSSRLKYLVRLGDGSLAQLRLYEESERDFLAEMVELMQSLAQSGLTLSEPLDWGQLSSGHYYLLLIWLEGQDLEQALPGKSLADQYQLGRQAGCLLKSINQLPLPVDKLPQETKLAKKQAQFDRYLQSPYRLADDEDLVAFVQANWDKILHDKLTYLHADFHIRNLILQPNGQLGLIDFDGWEIGDPYEEFYKLESFALEISPVFACGQLDAYFDGPIPQRFWETQAFYTAHSGLWSIAWAAKYGQKAVADFTRRCQTSVQHYDRFRHLIPSWYQGTKQALEEI